MLPLKSTARAICLLLGLASLTNAQEATGQQSLPDITQTVSATYQIPVLEGHLLIPQGAYGTEAPIKKIETVGANGGRITQEVPQQVVIAPYGTPVALDLAGINRAWSRFWLLRNYRKAEAPNFQQSVRLGISLLDRNSRNAIAASMGKQLPDAGASALAFAEFLETSTDEFDKFDYHELMKREYGAAAPASGRIRVLVFRKIDFGLFNSNENALNIIGETRFLVDLDPEDLLPERDFRTNEIVERPDGFAVVNRQNFALKDTLPLEPASARPFVRAMQTIVDKRKRMRRVWVAEAGEIRLPLNPEDPITYEPDQLTLYLDEGLSKPVTTISHPALYENIGVARAAKEQANLAAKSDRLAQALARSGSYDFDVAGIKLGMTLNETRAALASRKAPFAIPSGNRQGTSTGASNCNPGANQRIYQLIASERLRIGGDESSIRDSDRAALLAFEAEQLEGLHEFCRVDLRPFQSIMTAEADLGADVTDRVRVYFGTAGFDRKRVAAVIRSFDGITSIPTDPLAALVARYGPPLHSSKARSGFERDDYEPLYYWYLDPERAIGADAETVKAGCEFEQTQFSRNRVLQVSRYAASCGVMLALQYRPGSERSDFRIALLNTDLFGEAAKRIADLRERERQRAASLIEY